MLWCEFRLRVCLSPKLLTTLSPTELLFVWWLRVGGPAISFPGVPFIMRWKNRDEVPIPVADKKDRGLWERDWWSQWGRFALCNLVPRLSDLLVTAKFPSNSANPQLPCGSFRCSKNCATCPYISHGLATYTFFSTGETRATKFNLTCETKNLIYMIQCNHRKLQYIGDETTFKRPI